MKLIEQLIEQLHGQGDLSVEELIILARGGYYLGELPGTEPVREGPDGSARPPVADPTDDWEDASSRPPRRYGSRRAKVSGPQLTADELATHLAEDFPGWGAILTPLVQIARRIAS